MGKNPEEKNDRMDTIDNKNIKKIRMILFKVIYAMYSLNLL